MNWFRARGEVSSGAVEGLNNKIRAVTRRAYGFRTYNAMETALYHTLGRRINPQILLTRQITAPSKIRQVFQLAWDNGPVRIQAWLLAGFGTTRWLNRTWRSVVHRKFLPEGTARLHRPPRGRSENLGLISESPGLKIG